MGDVRQFLSCESRRERGKAIMTAQEKKSCDRILEVAYELAVDRINTSDALRTSKYQSVISEKQKTMYLSSMRVWLLEKALQQAMDEDRQRTREFLGIA